LIEVDCSEGKMTFERVDEDLPVYAMFRAAGINLPEDRETSAAALLLHKPAATKARGYQLK
jgi:hypothetical protein